jgi:hypothetical protein
VTASFASFDSLDSFIPGAFGLFFGFMYFFETVRHGYLAFLRASVSAILASIHFLYACETSWLAC